MTTAPRPLRSRRRLLQQGLGLLLIGAALTAASGSRAQAQSPNQAQPSTPTQLALAEHLKLKGVLFYGAWWCPHCQHQKELFGTPASERLPYVECDKEPSGRERCNAAQVRAYPTWDFKGDRREGVLTLEELEVWTGFPTKASTGSKAGTNTKTPSSR